MNQMAISCFSENFQILQTEITVIDMPGRAEMTTKMPGRSYGESVDYKKKGVNSSHVGVSEEKVLQLDANANILLDCLNYPCILSGLGDFS